MALLKTIEDRIKADGRAHWLNTKGDQGEIDYIAGATAEAERSQKLVAFLEKMKSDPQTWLNEFQWRELESVLAEYHNPVKEKL